MSRKPTSKRTLPKPKAVLRLPDLDQAKSAVLNSLTSGDAQRGYVSIQTTERYLGCKQRIQGDSLSRTALFRFCRSVSALPTIQESISLRAACPRWTTALENGAGKRWV
jgi:hypothetical protein